MHNYVDSKPYFSFLCTDWISVDLMLQVCDSHVDAIIDPVCTPSQSFRVSYKVEMFSCQNTYLYKRSTPPPGLMLKAFQNVGSMIECENIRPTPRLCF